MTSREVDVRPLLGITEFGSKMATREVIDAIDLASDQGQDTWLTDGEGGKRIARIVPADETTAAEQLARPVIPAEMLTLVIALRFRLCNAAFKGSYVKTRREQGELRMEAYSYSNAIEDLYRVCGVETIMWLPLRLEGAGQLDSSAEQIAREWIGPASCDRILGKRP